MDLKDGANTLFPSYKKRLEILWNKLFKGGLKRREITKTNAIDKKKRIRKGEKALIITDSIKCHLTQMPVAIGSRDLLST